MYTLQQILKVDVDKMEANFWDEKKTFRKNIFFLVAAVDQPYLDLKFESNPSILTVPTNSLNTHLFRYKNEAFALDIVRAPMAAIICFTTSTIFLIFRENIFRFFFVEKNPTKKSSKNVSKK